MYYRWVVFLLLCLGSVSETFANFETPPSQPDPLFRGVHDVAIGLGFGAGLPTLHSTTAYGMGRVYGAILFKQEIVTVEQVELATLRSAHHFAGPGGDIGWRMRAAHDYAVKHPSGKYLTGFSTFHDGYLNGKPVATLVLIKKGPGVSLEDVPASKIAGVKGLYFPAGGRIRGVFDFAVRQGRYAGFTTYHQRGTSGGEVFGVVYLDASSVLLRDINYLELNIVQKFEYDREMGDENARALMRENLKVLSRVVTCNAINPDERVKLLRSYGISHRYSVLGQATGLSYTTTGQQQTFINLNNLLKMGWVAAPEVLIKELMVAAGYPEPTKKPTDQPLDNGPYFGSAPLRSQLCMAGCQINWPAEGGQAARQCDVSRTWHP